MVGGRVEDLIHLAGPLTEDAVLKSLHASFTNNQLHVRFPFFQINISLCYSFGYTKLTFLSTLSSVCFVDLNLFLHSSNFNLED